MRDDGATLEELREMHEECSECWNWDERSQKAVDRWFIAASLGVEAKPSRKKQ